MRATLISFDDKFTSWTLLGANWFRPCFQLYVLLQFVVVDVIQLGFELSLCLSLLKLFTRLLDMIESLALETVSNTATGTKVVGLIFSFPEKQVFAIISRALFHVRVLVSDFFPLEFLASLHLIGGQKVYKIRQRDRQLAPGLGAKNRKLASFDTRFKPRVDALKVVNVRTDSHCEHVRVLTKEWLLADLANFTLHLAFFSLLFF